MTHFGLTNLGILITCLVDEEIHSNRKLILKQYEKYQDKTRVIKILEMINDPLPELDSKGELKTVFSPEKFTINYRVAFYKKLSWLLYDASHEYDGIGETLDKIRTYIEDSGIYEDFATWLKERIFILEIELDYHKSSAEWMKVDLDN